MKHRAATGVLMMGLIVASGFGIASATEISIDAEHVKEFEYHYQLDIPTGDVTETWACSNRPVRLRKATTVGGNPVTISELFKDRAAMDFNTYLIPDNAVILSVELRYYLRQRFTYSNNPISFKRMPGPIANFSGHQCFGGYIQIGNGPEYAVKTNNWEGYNTVDLGPMAVADLQSRLAEDWFTVGLKMKFDLLGDYDDSAELSAAHDPDRHKLIVKYRLKNTGGPLPVAAVEESTWGKVKALYNE